MLKVYKVTLNEMDGSHTFHTSYKKAVKAMSDAALADDKTMEDIDVNTHHTYYTFEDTTFRGVIETIFVN